MVFPSIPPYFDPSNWHQFLQQQNHQLIGSTSTNPLLPPQPHPRPLPPPQPHGAGGSPGTIRPGSMAEQARMNNTLPETTLKCPRCDSSNTKFCYYNNYNLSQPRHFCKSCRRYWTKGGALRNVPVGGGCRRNKRSKSTTSSKSPANRTDGQTISSSTSNMSTNSGATILGLTPPLRGFMSPLTQLNENFGNELVLNNYGGVSAPMVGSTHEMNSFHNNLFSGGGGIDTWRLQQSFPFLGGLDNSNLNGIYQFHNGENGFMGSGGEGSNQLHMMRPRFPSSMISHQQTPLPVKMEENAAEMSHSRRLLDGEMAGTRNDNDHDHQWNIGSAGGGVATNWTDLSSFSSSSTSNAL